MGKGEGLSKENHVRKGRMEMDGHYLRDCRGHFKTPGAERRQGASIAMEAIVSV
jgi:hypothetical protein